MLRCLPALLALVLLAPAPASAEVVVARAPEGLAALAAHAGSAYAVVHGSDDRLTMYRSGGRSATRLGAFGERGGETPALAAGPDGVAVVWARRISGGVEMLLADAPQSAGGGFGRTLSLGSATGPPLLAPARDGWNLAFPDRIGDATVMTGAGEESQAVATLTSTAPERRHLPLALAGHLDEPYVLDLIQSRERSELRLLGRDAPSQAVVAAAGVRGLRGSLWIANGVAYVAYFAHGRAVLAQAELDPGATWSRRTLAGPGGGEGAPSVARADGTNYVAYAQRRGGSYDLYLNGRAVTSGRDNDLDPRLAATPEGAVFLGWSRRERRSGHQFAVLKRTR